MKAEEAKRSFGRDREGKEVTTNIFNKYEIERADAILRALEGMSIESAQLLLKKVSEALLRTILT